MSLVVLYLSTAIVFLGLDVIGLRYLIRPVFERQIGDLLADPFRLGPAAVFYLFYVLALLILVTAPMLETGSYGRIALKAALFGAVGYGTYEFTNLATLKAWTWGMVALDLSWGIFLTTVAALAGVAITRALT